MGIKGLRILKYPDISTQCYPKKLVYKYFDMFTCEQMGEVVQFIEFESFKQHFEFVCIQHLTFNMLISYLNIQNNI